MNLPIKVLNSNALSYETKIKYQILSKKYYKYQKKLISASKEVFSSPIFDQETSININKKEDIIKWLNSMDITTRIKTFSIENKWLSSMIQQMFALLKRDPYIKFKYNKEEILINEELKNVVYPFQLNNNPFSSELMFSLDQFFVCKSGNEYSDLCIAESHFCQEIRFFDSEESNDIITFSANSLSNIDSFFNNYVNKFTRNKAFTKMCKVSYDMFNNFYFWNYPEWFDTTAYNSLAEICFAYVEQIICIKYWIYETSLLKEKPEKILSLNFLNDTKFNDIFEKREKIKIFLEDQFQNQKEKLFSEKISLNNILKDLKNDQNITSKIKQRKNESKSCFYPGPHSQKDIIQSGSIYKSEMYQENEMIDNIKKSYLNSKEVNFIDEIMFSDVNRLSNTFLNKDTLKDFLYKGIFDNVYNLYTEKNANDLLNENFLDNDNISANINDKIKKKQKVKNSKKKKTETVQKKSISDIKKIDSNEEEKETEKEKSQKKLLEQIKSYNKFTNKKSKSFNDLKQLFFNKDVKFFVANNEMIRYCADLDSENDLYNQEILIKNTVSKVLENIYISLGENDYSRVNHEELCHSKLKDKKDNKNKSKLNNKLKKNNKKTEKRINKDTIESEKTDTDTEHSNNVHEKYFYNDNRNRNLIEVKEIERIRKNKTCERKLYGLNKISKFVKTEEIKTNEKIEEENYQINIANVESAPIVKTRDKSKKKKHRQKYKTNNNKNVTKTKKENEPTNEIKKFPSVIHSTHSLPEKKGSFDKKDSSEYKKLSTNVVSKNFNLSIIADKEKSLINDQSKPYLYTNNFNEDLRKNKGYNSSYNKFNNFGSSGTSHQFFNNRNLNYNRYMDESSMVINNYNINFNMNIMNNLNIMQKIEGFYPNFYFQLHNELLDYSNSINEINLMLKDVKVYSISYVENIIKQVLNCQIIIDIYGSFATDLCIESSDIDLTVRIMDPNINISEELFTKLSQDIEKLKVFDSVNPITTASVPILKLIIDPKKIIDKSNKILENYENFLTSNLYKNYYFKKEELLKIKIDINVTNAHAKTFSTYSSVEWAKKQITVFPEIKILLQYLKRFLQIHKLNSSFNGLNSFDFRRIIFLFSFTHFGSIRHLLAEFFEFFGKFFDFKFGVIDVNQPNPILRYNNILDVYPCILDPITYLNVSKNSFRIQEISDLFAKCFDIISQIKFKFDKNDFKETSILYSILNLSELK